MTVASGLCAVAEQVGGPERKGSWRRKEVGQAQVGVTLILQVTSPRQRPVVPSSGTVAWPSRPVYNSRGPDCWWP